MSSSSPLIFLIIISIIIVIITIIMIIIIIAFDEGEGFLISWVSVNASESSECFLGFRAGS